MPDDRPDLAALQRGAEETWVSEFLVGPTRTRLTELPPQDGDLAPDVGLPDSSGTLRPGTSSVRAASLLA